MKIDELFKVKIFDKINKYITSKSNLSSFSQYYKYQKKVYSNFKLNLYSSKKSIKYFKNDKVGHCNVRIDKNNKITQINYIKTLPFRNQILKNIILKHQLSLKNSIIEYYKIPNELFKDKYYKNQFHSLSTSEHKFKLKNIPMLLVVSIETFPEVKRAHLELSLVVEKIWKKNNINDLEFVEVKKL